MVNWVPTFNYTVFYTEITSAQMKKGLDLWWCMENISHNIGY